MILLSLVSKYFVLHSQKKCYNDVDPTPPSGVACFHLWGNLVQKWQKALDSTSEKIYPLNMDFPA